MRKTTSHYYDKASPYYTKSEKITRKTSCYYDKNSDKASCYYKKSSVLREKHCIITIKHLLFWEEHPVLIRKHVKCSLNNVRVGGVHF